MGIPTIANIKKYGNRNAPPPFLKQEYNKIKKLNNYVYMSLTNIWDTILGPCALASRWFAGCLVFTDKSKY